MSPNRHPAFRTKKIVFNVSRGPVNVNQIALNPRNGAARGAIKKRILRQNGKKQWIRFYALSYSDAGLAQMTKTDKACCLMEWNDDYRSSFEEIRVILLEVDI